MSIRLIFIKLYTPVSPTPQASTDGHQTKLGD